MKRLLTLKEKFVVNLLSSLVGIITGLIAALFGIVLLKITSYREVYYAYLLPVLPIASLLIVFLYHKFTEANKSGLGLVFDVASYKEKKIPLVLIPLIVFCTWLTHLFGASAGREGVSIQIGGVVGHNIGLLTKNEDIAHVLLVAGMAAGFSGLFQTPLAAVFFALEVLVVGSIKYYALFPAMIASLSAYTTSKFVGLEQFRVELDVSFDFDFSFLLQLLVLGISFGLAGKVFAELLSFLKKFFKEKLSCEYKRIFTVAVVIALTSFFIYAGRYSGLGTNIIHDAFYGGTIYKFDWILKLLFTVVTIAAGFKGGEVTPLFAIGASLGAAISVSMGFPVVLGAALGYAAVFSAATNTLLGPIFIGAEVFGYHYIMLFAIVCTISFLISGNSTIYPAQQTSLGINKFIE